MNLKEMRQACEDMVGTWEHVDTDPEEKKLRHLAEEICQVVAAQRKYKELVTPGFVLQLLDLLVHAKHYLEGKHAMDCEIYDASHDVREAKCSCVPKLLKRLTEGIT